MLVAEVLVIEQREAECDGKQVEEVVVTSEDDVDLEQYLGWR